MHLLIKQNIYSSGFQGSINLIFLKTIMYANHISKSTWGTSSPYDCHNLREICMCIYHRVTSSIVLCYTTKIGRNGCQNIISFWSADFGIWYFVSSLNWNPYPTILGLCGSNICSACQGDVMTWKYFPRNQPFWGKSTGHQWIPLT